MKPNTINIRRRPKWKRILWLPWHFYKVSQIGKAKTPLLARLRIAAISSYIFIKILLKP